MDNTLPENYVDIGAGAMHAQDLAKFTADIDRFLKYLPAAIRMAECENDENVRATIWCHAEDPEALMLTIAEHSELLTRLAYTIQVTGRPPGPTH